MDLTKLIFKKEQLRLAIANINDCFNDVHRHNFGCEGGCAGSCEGCCADTCVNDCYADCTGKLNIDDIEQSNDSAEY